MFRTIIWFAYFWLYALYACIWLFKIDRLNSKGQQQQAALLSATIPAKWCKMLIKLAGTSVEINGLKHIPDRNVLFVSNHQGDFDIPLLLSLIDKPKGFIAKTELQKIPLISIWMQKINCVFMDRSNSRQSLKAILKAIDLLKKGTSLVVFPEGSRSGSSNLGDFKPGTMKLALRSQVPIVPVTINGSYKIMQPGSYKINPANVKIIISKPIYVDQLTKDEQATLSDTVRAVIAGQLED
ncbi:MAG: 1-acyl-sn-glycerol-3-phosphate acyltransferase [Desulfotomaculum sp.]|nr:1-acyl-sn-glycerol-3-phosphate acyltransferase [Desulfotomaculum sp.]MCL0080917.1 1-acyl-sn-glycerol-3-phosphate acyltransferase [Peptococcaceae bacterium]